MDIQFYEDDAPMRDEMTPGHEVARLKTLLLGLGKPVWPADRIDRRPNGELSLISFRELGANCILEWIHKSPTHKFPRIHINDVSRLPGKSIRYQIDFSLADENTSGYSNPKYFVLRIFDLPAENRYRVVIQNKGSDSNTPFGISATDPSTVWLREVSVNEALYTEQELRKSRW